MAKRAVKYISFYLGDILYAFPLLDGVQFISVDRPTPSLPHSPKIKGLIYNNGEIILIVNIAFILGVKAKTEHMALLFNYQGDHYGLLLDEGGVVIKSNRVFSDRQSKDLKKYIKIKKDKVYILEPAFICNQLGLNYD